MPEIVNIDMEAALTGGAEWTSTTIGSGQALVRATDSGLFGSVAGAKLTIGGTTDVFAQKTFSAISSTAATFRLATSGLASLTVSSGTPSHQCYRILAGGVVKGWLEWKYTGSEYRLRLHHLDDPGATHSTSEYQLTEATTYIQLKYEKSSADGNTNAAFSLYFNDTLKERKTGLEIWDHFDWDEIRVGAFSTVDAVTTGVWKFDKIVFRDDGTLPGSPAVAPVVDAGANQTGTLGTPKVVTTVSFTDTDAVECNLTCDANGTISVVANGSANVTGNGTNSVNITGTNAEILATIDSTNGITLNRSQVAWSNTANPPPAGYFDYEDTILVEVIDSGALSHSDGFTMEWDADSGDGKNVLLLDNATLAGINGELDLAHIIPVADTEYTEYAYLEVTDGNGNVDWVLVPITISALQSGGGTVLSGVCTGVLQGVM